MPQQFLDVQTPAEALLVRVTVPKIDDANAQEFGQLLLALADQAARHDLHPDLDGVRHLGSEALAQLPIMNWKVQAAGDVWRCSTSTTRSPTRSR